MRDYDPSAGRYVQRDPVGLYGGLNGYVYGYNLPTRYIDPNGLIASCTLVDPGTWVTAGLGSKIIRDDSFYDDNWEFEFDRTAADAQLPSYGRHPLNNPPACPAVMLKFVLYRTHYMDFAVQMWKKMVKIKKYRCEEWLNNQCGPGGPFVTNQEVPEYRKEDLGTFDRQFIYTERVKEGFGVGVAFCPKI